MGVDRADGSFRAHPSAAPLKRDLVWCCHHSVLTFRAHPSAAPLKQTGHARTFCLGHSFRAHPSAAPLKPFSFIIHNSNFILFFCRSAQFYWAFPRNPSFFSAFISC